MGEEQNKELEQQQKQQPEKTFTQSEVTRMMTAEKEQGRRSVLKELGVEDIASAKESLQKYQEFLNSQKTELEQAQEAQAKLQSDYAAAIAKASHAENCVVAMKLGANTESVDDLVALAVSKVTEGKDLEAVISEMKSNSVYAGFFKNSVGTGNAGMQNHPAGESEPTSSLAKTLAERQLSQRTTKSNFFKMS